MPSTNEALRAKFMTKGDDGIEKAERLIIGAGGSIDYGWIVYNGDDPAVLEAVQFLIEEWDYAIGPRPAELSAMTLLAPHMLLQPHVLFVDCAMDIKPPPPSRPVLPPVPPWQPPVARQPVSREVVLPGPGQEPPAWLQRSLDEVEKEHARLVLLSHAGNKSRACRVLKIQRSTLDRKLKKWLADDAATSQPERTT